ncbi:MAG: branched-chain amino acid transport system ATP-binding protein, partial [Candidatus Eremiobacteraeota bacterium]|nr:branched-chain amino acid transport system ATP-binding protein [Candidatus Eremiobacteraeota bacterium]
LVAVSASSGAALQLSDVHVYYGASWILKGVSLAVPPGGVVALLGRNGAGKSTTLKTVMGLVAPRAGSVRFGDAEIGGRSPHAINRLGIAYVPEERRVFSDLTVDEHLAIAARGGGWTAERIFRVFPALVPLRERRGRFLSGGEQQMLAIARALVTGPRLLLLDEPSQGLAPVIVDAVISSVEAMRDEGLAILLVEQNVELALDVADRCAIIDQGAIVFGGTAAALRGRSDLQSTYLGVGT